MSFSRFLHATFIGLLVCLAVPAGAAKLREIATIELPGEPGFDSLAWAGNLLLIAHRGAATVDVFDPVRRHDVAHIDGIADPRGIAVDQEGKRVFIADASKSSIAVVGMDDWKLAGSIPVDAAAGSLLLAGHVLYYTALSQASIGVVDIGARHQVATIALDGRPSQIVWDAQPGVMYATEEDCNEIAVINASSGEVKQQYHLNASQPTGLVLDGANRRLYVAVRYAVLSVDIDNGSEVSRVPTPGGTDALSYSRDDHALYAVASDGTIQAIGESAGALTVGSELKTSVKGHSMAFDAGKKILYVPGGQEGRSKLVILKQFGLNASDAASAGSQVAGLAR